MGLALLATACGGDDPVPPAGPQGATALFDVSGPLAGETFFDFPFPSDVRLVDGSPDLSGFPNPNANELVDNLLPIAQDRRGFGMVPVGYFRFAAPIEPRDANLVVAAAPTAPVLLIDVDPDSPERGRLLPVVTSTPAEDAYVPSGLLTVAPRPGFVLHHDRSYAFVVTNALTDATGLPVSASESFATLAAGGTPVGERGAAAATTHADLWPALDLAGVDRNAVVSASVFTTGDPVAELSALGDAVRAEYDLTIDDLAVDPDDGAEHPRFCELHGTIAFPQFQVGEPPFSTDGLFEFDADGLPIEQRTEVAPLVIALPNGEMPAGGYPLVMYFHGSGGLAAQVIDRGTAATANSAPKKGEGPAHVLAELGIASVGSAHPLNPERLPGASEIEYLNINNLKAFRDTFRQGVLEQRMYLDALLELEIDPATVAACSGLSLPAGETSYRFRAEPIMAMGQSMGGMYTNLIGATDPRIEAVVPTGAGGFWSFFILETTLVPGSALVPALLESGEVLTFMHPGLNLLEMGWEPAEPMVFMPRLGYRPLPGHPARDVYEPVGKDDSFFPTSLYDAIALAYGHQQAGDEVWPTMQEALALAELDGIVDYPVAGNLTGDAGPFTGVVVQYAGDGFYDPHSIFAQLDEVKHQYRCFFASYLAGGEAEVLAPASLDSACQ